MKTLLVVAGMLCAAVLHGAEPKSSPQKTSDLFQLSRKLPDAGSDFRLSPEWVGTVKRVYLRSDDGPYVEDKPNDLRLTHAWVATPRGKRGGEPFLQAARRSQNEYAGNEAPVFRKSLPSVKEIAAMTHAELNQTFGPQHGWTDVWGSDGDRNWTEGWTWFTFETPKELRFLHVFAHVRRKAKADQAEIRILGIREGKLRPADPASAEEKRKFKAGEELAQIAERERQADLKKYPEPL